LGGRGDFELRALGSVQLVIHFPLRL
jgi:hypothetical protein